MDPVRMVGPVAWLNVPTSDNRGVRSIDCWRVPVPLMGLLSDGDSRSDDAHVPVALMGSVTEAWFTDDGVLRVVAECSRPDMLPLSGVVPCGVDLGGGEWSTVDDVEWSEGAQLMGVTLYVGRGSPSWPNAQLSVVGAVPAATMAGMEADR